MIIKLSKAEYNKGANKDESTKKQIIQRFVSDC